MSITEYRGWIIEYAPVANSVTSANDYRYFEDDYTEEEIEEFNLASNAPSKYAAMLDIDWIMESGSNCRDMINFMVALYHFCCDYHGGQGCKFYSLSSCLIPKYCWQWFGFVPTLDIPLTYTQTQIYHKLRDKHVAQTT